MQQVVVQSLQVAGSDSYKTSNGRRLFGSFLQDTVPAHSLAMAENNTDFLLPSPTDASNLNTTLANSTAYDYDYDLSDSTLPLAEFIPVLVVYGLVLILGFVGNTLVILGIALCRRLRSVTNIFLVSLASADLLLVSICIPIKVSTLQRTNSNALKTAVFEN